MTTSIAQLLGAVVVFAFGLVLARPMLAGILSGAGVLIAYVVYFAVHERRDHWLQLFMLVSPFLTLPVIGAFVIGYIGGTLTQGRSKAAQTKLQRAAASTGHSYSFKAGRMIGALGWIMLLIDIFLGGMLVIALAKGNAGSFVLWAVYGVLVVETVACFVVAAGLKNHHSWARGAGLAISVLSLANVPFGTVLGMMALANIIKGWHESELAV